MTTLATMIFAGLMGVNVVGTMGVLIVAALADGKPQD